MKNRMSAGMIVLVMALVALTGFSCSKEKQAKEKPSGHDAMVEQFLKNTEELKKVVVARVNGANITKYDLFTRAQKRTSDYLQSGRQKTPEMERQIKKEALDELIFRELAIQEAIRRNMKVEQQNIGATLQRYKAKIGTEKEYAEHLKRKNLTEASLIKLIEREQLFRMIIAEEISAKIKVDEKLVRDIYAKGKKKEPGRQMTFEGARGRIEEDLKKSLAEKRKQQWEAELKKHAKIEVIDAGDLMGMQGTQGQH